MGAGGGGDGGGGDWVPGVCVVDDGESLMKQIGVYDEKARVRMGG